MGLEHELVHPATEELLKSYRWPYRHEVTIPGAGRADFVVFGPDERPLVVIECKAKRTQLSKGVSQARRYRSALKCPMAVVILPKSVITPLAVEFAEKNNVMLWGVNIVKMSLPPRRPPEQIVIPPMVKSFSPLPTEEDIRLQQERDRCLAIWNRIKAEGR
jgi:hypothetical protein